MIQRTATALLAGLCVAALAGHARADDNGMAQLLPGLMCESPDALARLTLPDGSSRAAHNPSPQNLALKAEGKCLDLSDDVSLTLVTRRRNTSIVTADPRDGKGSRTFYVPNVDFSLDAPNLPVLRAASPAGAIPEHCYREGENVTLAAAIGSKPFTPDIGRPYTYRFLRFPEPVCVIEQSPYARIASLAYIQSEVNTGSIPDGATVTVSGGIATVDTSNQPLTLRLFADRVTRR
jgi:hypothetical protein